MVQAGLDRSLRHAGFGRNLRHREITPEPTPKHHLLVRRQPGHRSAPFIALVALGGAGVDGQFGGREGVPGGTPSRPPNWSSTPAPTSAPSAMNWAERWPG